MPASIRQVQYYDSTNCTDTGYRYGQSTQQIPQSCNKVHVPGEYDDDTWDAESDGDAGDAGSGAGDDDVLATTQYIGTECVIVYSSPAPSQQPSSAPTVTDLIEFSATQVCWPSQTHRGACIYEALYRTNRPCLNILRRLFLYSSQWCKICICLSLSFLVIALLMHFHPC